MARIRTVKPEFFRNIKLFKAEQESGLPMRLAFSGLWVACDRSGRFKWSPEELKLDVLPFDDVDFSRVLHALVTRGYVVKYRVNDDVFGCIPSWDRHQVINNREKESDIPDVSTGQVLTEDDDASSTRDPRDTEKSKGKGKEGKGMEGKGREDSALRTVVPTVTNTDPLYAAIWQSFLAVSGSFADYAKEGKLTKGICEKVRNLAPENPMVAAKVLLETYRALTESSERFWGSQPFTPSGLSPVVERVWAEAKKKFQTHDNLNWLDEEGIV